MSEYPDGSEIVGRLSLRTSAWREDRCQPAVGQVGLAACLAADEVDGEQDGDGSELPPIPGRSSEPFAYNVEVSEHGDCSEVSTRPGAHRR